MSEYEDFDEAEDSQEQTSKNPLRERMRALEAENKAFRQQQKDIEEAKKQLAFVKAGVDPEDAAAKYFYKGYDGELSTEAIKQAAIEARLLSPAEDPGIQAEKDAWSRTNQAAAGADSPTSLPDLDERLMKAKSSSEIMSILAEVQNQ